MDAAQIRLIVTDMDGTLLDGERRLPRHFAAIVNGLQERGVRWAIASGRQFANLRAQFDALGVYPDILAENGALAVEGGASVPFFEDLTPATFFEDILERAMAIPQATPVLCGADLAWVQDAYPDNFEQVTYYFARTDFWHSLREVRNHEVCKIAIYHPDAANGLWPALAPFAREDRKVILSSPYWIDVQSARINKGNALKALLERRGLRPDQAVVFGDYLNDAEMMPIGAHSVAMGNAHPQLKALCRYQTRPNTEEGVVWFLRQQGILS